MKQFSSWRLRLIPRLVRPGYLLVQLLFLVFFTLMGVSVTPLWTQVFAGVVSFIYLLNMHADRWNAYHALNLPAWLYRRHRQFIAFVTLLIIVPLGLVMNSSVQAGFPWVWLIGVAAGMLHLLFGQEADPWQHAARVQASREKQSGELRVRSPIGEIIRRPQWMLWGGLWGATAVAVTITVGLDYLYGDGLFAGAGVPNGLSVLPIILVTVLMFSRAWENTLRHWVVFGGDRRTWSNETRISVIASSSIGVAFAGVFAFLLPAIAGAPGDLEMFVGMAGSLIAVPPTIFAMQFLSASRDALINGVTILLAVVVWTGPLYIHDHRLLFLLGVLVLVWWAVTLEYQARRRNVFRVSGFQSFFGTAKPA